MEVATGHILRSRFNVKIKTVRRQTTNDFLIYTIENNPHRRRRHHHYIEFVPARLKLRNCAFLCAYGCCLQRATSNVDIVYAYAPSYVRLIFHGRDGTTLWSHDPRVRDDYECVSVYSIVYLLL